MIDPIYQKKKGGWLDFLSCSDGNRQIARRKCNERTSNAWNCREVGNPGLPLYLGGHGVLNTSFLLVEELPSPPEVYKTL